MTNEQIGLLIFTVLAVMVSGFVCRVFDVAKLILRYKRMMVKRDGKPGGNSHI